MIKMPENPDPKSNLVEFKKGKREPTMQVARHNYDACRHIHTIIDNDTRSVTCRDCKILLDAFTVLLELAHKERRWLSDLDEWDARRESLLAERYDEQWAKQQATTTEPPADRELRKIWDDFGAYLGPKFCGMYRRKQRKINGPDWYGKTTDGGMYSYEYVRSQLVPKAVKP